MHRFSGLRTLSVSPLWCEVLLRVITYRDLLVAGNIAMRRARYASG